MATYDDEYIDSYFYSSYNPYAYRYTKPKGMGRKQKTYLNYGDPEAYFDTHRAHLKSVLSQINPKLTPRLRRANTHDVGVQVNPKTDASVQCSLGPRTLMARKRDALRKRSQEDPQSPGSPVGGVRYPRSLAVYSPIATRRLASFLEENKRESRGAQTREQKEDVKVNTDDKTSEEKSGPGTKSTKVNGQSIKTDEVEVDKEGSKSKARVRFQFLEQKYGYYHCRECNLRWESAYVWCVQGTNKVYFKQFCRTCQKSFNPYRVEDITCQNCNKARCSCAVTPRHVDPKRPHRQDLCGRCKGKRLSCDSTFSFKYII
ncbi:zygote arrest protein 1 [Hypomesus transpacificus]|uniref:zygote arrest protein 1 n=1 Tax=Hypomesus transpacificus TaxID=137520 RepID=UPI001F07B160|nr:zygote arrest protein 1 [Hypomesus transpacificus]